MQSATAFTTAPDYNKAPCSVDPPAVLVTTQHLVSSAMIAVLFLLEKIHQVPAKRRGRHKQAHLLPGGHWYY